MSVKREILKIIAASIFALALLLPTVVQFAHSFEGHKHEACIDISTHFHEKQLDCSICDFHFSIFNFTPQQFAELVIQEGFQKTEIPYFVADFTLNSTHYFLRGPPLFS